ncbi:GNAT family N-acetyltransferase [Leptolyngbya sp. FACHB-711]|uniref:GNAT family N-acetyltransferase n=1 Tax=unclassified Leptolyngbya TaxID=2650499 RepID=UPI00168637D7|nr:GNAT family N-acetyltransferase [Leptolyngbya sp. FACHB-711]MBD1853476.1 GNAT family N-acetyltransferase [Cyanobacteria bacterium FACHB-502]MBD2027459.1 GNAT family N-acetyltransferase [Leptolyngbya sp. FACHB-711]
MLTLTARPYTGQADLQPLTNLINQCEAADREEELSTIEEVKQELGSPGFDPMRDMRLWEESGEILAVAQIWLPQADDPNLSGYLCLYVHPDRRYQGLEPEMIAWAEARMRQVGQIRQQESILRCGSQDIFHDRIAIIETAGFVLERQFFTMRRSLLDPIPDPVFPVGYQLLDGCDELDEAASVELYNQTFIDHWNFHPLTIEQLQHWLAEPNYRPELDLVAVAPDGTYAGFCFCSSQSEANKHQPQPISWVNALGTRRGFRRMGLGRALLLAGLHRLRSIEMEIAHLGVDLNNPNQALSLYESIGFEPIKTWLTYSKAIT